VVAQGHAIGQIATASDIRLRTLLRKSVDSASEKGSGQEPAPKQKFAMREDEYGLGRMLDAVEAYDYAQAERELGRLAAATPSPRDLVHRLAFPLMRIAGERWHDGKFTIAQEHMITALLSGLFASMLRLYAPANPRAKLLMATPENEHHGFGILAAAMLSAAGGLGPIHLGTNLPTRDIIQAARKTETNVILLGLCGAKSETAVPVLQAIQSKVLSRTKLWVGGASPPVAEAASKLGWIVLKDFQALERQLEFLGTRF
jgi:MerR family transcriptional regulator, light-induced transcriptional regulator